MHLSYLRQLIGEHGEKALDIAWAVAQGKRTYNKWFSAEGGPVERECVPTAKEQAEAAISLYEHLKGKPKQAVEHSGDGTAPVLVSIGWKPKPEEK